MPSVMDATQPLVADMASQMVVTMDQVIATVENELSSLDKTIIQEVAQDVADMEQQWDHLLGINPPSQSPSPGSGSHRRSQGHNDRIPDAVRAVPR